MPPENSCLCTKKEIDKIFEILSESNPAPQTELNYTNNYTLLVAVALSAQSTDKGVNRATADLFKVCDSPEQMLALGEAGLKEHIKTIGLYNNKAKNIMKLSKILVEKHGGEVPYSREALEALPGVGRKTANVVLSVAFGEPTLAVDTHVFRVSNRVGLARGTTPAAVEIGLLKVIPEKWLYHAHHWLILHGRYICKAIKPSCQKCKINKYCKYENKTIE